MAQGIRPGEKQNAREVYGDIIDHPHWVSPKHPQMSLYKRAAQFAPFAALSGYGEAVDEAGRLTDRRQALSEEALETLNRRLRALQERSVERPPVTLVYFREDPRKEGGACVSVSGRFRQVDPVRGEIVLEDWQRVALEDLYEVRSPLFEED